MVSSSLKHSYKSVVIGAGPAGLAAVANLLDANVHPLLWVDPCFNSGRLSMYQLVPSNTKVQLFIDFALASPTLAHVVQNTSPSPIGELQNMDPNGTCLLKHTVKMVSELTGGVKKHFSNQMNNFQGWAQHITRQDHGDNKVPTWSIGLSEFENGEVIETVESPSVIFATGSHPIIANPSWAPHRVYANPGAEIEEISLETALNPTILSSSISPSDTVAVVGASHSAILCLKNLAELPNRPQKIVHYYRQELKYAVYMDGWILYDNTGLKGDAAVWAKEVLQAGKVPSLETHHLKDQKTEADIYKRTLPEVTKIIYAIGFARNKLPYLDTCRAAGAPRVEYLPRSGKLTMDGKMLPGLWGYGIAFPEETVDPYGNQEYAVGMWKFMRYMKRSFSEEVVPEIKTVAS